MVAIFVKLLADCATYSKHKSSTEIKNRVMSQASQSSMHLQAKQGALFPLYEIVGEGDSTADARALESHSMQFRV